MSRQAIMLAGGPSSRLHPYRTIVPKPLLPVGDRSVLDIVLRQLAGHGIAEAILAVGELAPLIRAMFGTGERHGLALRYAQEGDALGLGAVLGLAEPSEPFLVMNGNVLTTLDYGELFAAHAAAGNAVTVATFQRRVQADFGALEIERDEAGHARVVDYLDRPGTMYTASMGIYVMDPILCEQIAPGERVGLPDLILRLVTAGLPIGAYAHEGLWLDMGRQEDYEQVAAHHDVLAPELNGAARAA